MKKSNPRRDMAALLALILFAGIPSGFAQSDPAPGNLNYEKLREFVNYPAYRESWITFGEALGGKPDRNLKRLGLPVHGHWVKTWVNPVAANYIAENRATHSPLDPLQFPAGSCIVKENYPPNPNRTGFQPNASPGVLTVMYKNNPDFHQVAAADLPFNGKDGYLGGNWLFAFYVVLKAEGEMEQGFKELEKNVQSHAKTFCIVCHSPAYNTDYLRSLHSTFYPYAQKPTESYCDRVKQKLRMVPGFEPQDLPGEIQRLTDQLNAYANPAKLSPELPADVPIDPNTVFKYFGSAATQEMFASFAWKTFISLNWPNTGEAADRGEPDQSLPFTGVRSGPTVWETFKPTYEVFQPDKADWNPVSQPWNQEIPAIDCGNDQDTQATKGTVVITRSSKVREVPNEEGQAFAGTFGYLVDQNFNKVHYEVLFNRTEFEYLIAGDKAATKNLTPRGPAPDGILQPIRFPDNCDDERKVGSIEVKSAWRTLVIGTATKDQPFPDAPTLEAAKKKFYVRELQVYDAGAKKGEKCVEKKPLGLVGLHIAHKTYFSPQWVWMTFENKYNVPAYGEKTRSSFFNPDVAPNIPPNAVLKDCWTLPFLSFKDQVKNCLNVDINRFTFPNWPNQVTRLDPIGSAAARQNELYHALMEKGGDGKPGGSPFANYNLIDVQWPLNGRNQFGEVTQLNSSDNKIDPAGNSFTMIPPHLRNTSMESFMSTYCEAPNGAVQQFSNRSCMECHGTAGTDFSYIFLDAVTQRVPLQKD